MKYYTNGDVFKTTVEISFQVCNRITEFWSVSYETSDWKKALDTLHRLEKENPNFEYCLLKICTSKQYLRKPK